MLGTEMMGFGRQGAGVGSGDMGVALARRVRGACRSIQGQHSNQSGLEMAVVRGESQGGTAYKGRI